MEFCPQILEPSFQTDPQAAQAGSRNLGKIKIVAGDWRVIQNSEKIKIKIALTNLKFKNL